MCSGNESTLFDCPYNPIHNCNHFEDAGVRCSPRSKYDITIFVRVKLIRINFVIVCIDGDLRLVNGTSEMEGRIEICLDEAWGTICDNLWTTNDGNVACQQLGFSRIGLF